MASVIGISTLLVFGLSYSVIPALAVVPPIVAWALLRGRISAGPDGLHLKWIFVDRYFVAAALQITAESKKGARAARVSIASMHEVWQIELAASDFDRLSSKMDSIPIHRKASGRIIRDAVAHVIIVVGAVLAVLTVHWLVP